MRICYLSIP